MHTRTPRSRLILALGALLLAADLVLALAAGAFAPRASARLAEWRAAGGVAARALARVATHVGRETVVTALVGAPTHTRACLACAACRSRHLRVVVMTCELARPRPAVTAEARGHAGFLAPDAGLTEEGPAL